MNQVDSVWVIDNINLPPVNTQQVLIINQNNETEWSRPILSEDDDSDYIDYIDYPSDDEENTFRTTPLSSHGINMISLLSDIKKNEQNADMIKCRETNDVNPKKSQTECSVCLEQFQDNPKVYCSTVCGTIYHTECIMKSKIHCKSKNGFTCPYCRKGHLFSRLNP